MNRNQTREFVDNAGKQPSLQDRKNYTTYDSSFAGSSILELSSASRVYGTVGLATFTLPTPVSAWAMSLKSLALPVSWGNVLTPIYLQVTYYPGGQPYPLDITIPAGYYIYNLYQGEVTYTQVSAASAYTNENDLVWVLLRGFVGALQSIAINPATGVWTWSWNPAITSVTSTSPSVTNFFNINFQQNLIWYSSGLVDLTGTKIVCVACGELQSDAFFSGNTPVNSYGYICSVPVNQTYGDVIVHEPTQEVINWFGTDKPISTFTVAIVDPSTNAVLPLTIDYSMELRFFITRPIRQ